MKPMMATRNGISRDWLPGAEWLHASRLGEFERVARAERVMKLQIIWRNPHPPVLTKPLVRQIAADAYGALYEVRSRHQMNVFELILPRAA